MTKKKMFVCSEQTARLAPAAAEADLLEKVQRACDRLARLGWRELLLKHGLDITARNLGEELSKFLTVDRAVQGFEDFAVCGERGVEPGLPAHSLLYHA